MSNQKGQQNQKGLPNQNGQLLLYTLAKWQRPAKFSQLAAELCEEGNEQMESLLREILESGVRNGLIEKHANGKYSALVSRSHVKYLASGIGSDYSLEPE